MSLWILLTAHFIADFTLQPAEWAEKKTKEVGYLVRHALAYAGVFVIAAFGCIPARAVWLPFVIIVVSHFVIDWFRIYIDRKSSEPVVQFTSFLVDQGLHISIIYTVVMFWNLNSAAAGWLSTAAMVLPLDRILRCALIFAIILDPASVFVKKLTVYVSQKTNADTKSEEPPAGRIIGKLERIVIAMLVLCDETGAIGFVLTAKSLARYEQFKQKDFAEKYLIGTLSSTAIAIIAAVLLK